MSRRSVTKTQKGIGTKPMPPPSSTASRPSRAVVGPPAKQGLYDPQFEHEACGVGFVVNIKGRKSHDIIRQALRFCSTSIIAARAVVKPTRATARASSSRCRTTF